MSYGFLIVNSAGKELVLGSEETFLYWGKKSYTTSTTSDVNTSLFNIPSSVSTITFIHVNTSSRVKAYVRHVDGKIVMTTGRVSGFTATCYVFVVAKSVPVGSFGLSLWNNQGVLAFHSTRPALNILGTTFELEGKVTGVKTASIGIPIGMRNIPDPDLDGSIFHVLGKVGTDDSIIGTYIVDEHTPLQERPLAFFTQTHPYINAAYYDVYSSLGNWSQSN